MVWGQRRLPEQGGAGFGVEDKNDNIGRGWGRGHDDGKAEMLKRIERYFFHSSLKTPSKLIQLPR